MGPTCRIQNAPAVFCNTSWGVFSAVITPVAMGFLCVVLAGSGLNRLAVSPLGGAAELISSLFLSILSAAGWAMLPWRKVEIGVRQDGVMVEGPAGRRYCRWSDMGRLTDLPLAEAVVLFDRDDKLVFAAPYSIPGVMVLRELIRRRMSEARTGEPGIQAA
ncbi:MAG: hypothetical protein OEW11_00720 [Nitrospirota bacterium]|nr:hypothetical protein [Nitrospirota bacterium]